jgi:DNA-binding FadR family transcriptional regulator
MAAQHHDESAVRELRSLLVAAGGNAGEASLSRASEDKILRRIGEAASNEILTAALATIRSLLQVWLTRLPNSRVRGTASLFALGELIEAVGRSDVAAAQKAMGEYVDIANEGLLAVLPQDLSEQEMRQTAVV